MNDAPQTPMEGPEDGPGQVPPPEARTKGAPPAAGTGSSKLAPPDLTPRRRWADRLIDSLRTRAADSMAATRGVPPAVTLTLAGLLVVPGLIGWLVQAQVGAAQRPLESVLGSADAASDPVTAMAWSSRAGTPVLDGGTQQGGLFTFDSSGRLLSRGTAAGPVVAFEGEGSGGAAGVLAVTLAGRQWSEDLPNGSLAAGVGFGVETCLGGFVWREATVDDVVCVTPESRTRALQDNADALAAGEDLDPAEPPSCREGLVPRLANPNDRVCVDEQVAAETREENRLDQARKVLPDAARQDRRRVAVATPGGASIEGERGLLVVVGNYVLAGATLPVPEAPAKMAKTPEPPSAMVGESPMGLTQWSLGDGAPVEVGPVSGIEDVRVLERLPGTATVIAGDGAGGVFAIDASQQVSGVNPEQYLRRLGDHDGAITEISTAASPREGAPSVATLATDGTVKIWWPDQVMPSRSLTPLARYASVAPPGITFTRQARVSGGTFVSLAAMSGGGRHLVAVAADGRLALAAAPSPASSQAAPWTATTLPAGLAAPAALSSDGRLVAAFDAAAASIRIYQSGADGSQAGYEFGDMRPRDLLFSPAGDRLAIIGESGELRLVTLADRTVELVPLPAAVHSAAFNLAGSQLALGLADASVALVWRGRDGFESFIIAAAAPDVKAAAQPLEVRVDASGKRLLLFNPQGRETATRSIRLGRQTAWRPLGSADLESAALSLDGSRLLALGLDGGAVVTDVRSGHLTALEATGAVAIAASADGGSLALLLSDGSIDIYGEAPDPLTAGPMPPLASGGLRLSADGTTLLLRELSGRLLFWDVSTGANPPLALGAIPPVTASLAELAADGSFAVAAEASGVLHVIDLEDRRHVRLTGHGHLVQAMALSGDGRFLATASVDGRLRLTDLDKARLITALPLAHIPSRTLPPRLTSRTLAGARDQIDPFIQLQLDALGYGPVPENGIVGLATRAAIARWQADNGLPVNGEVDEQLIGALGQGMAQQMAN